MFLVALLFAYCSRNRNDDHDLAGYIDNDDDLTLTNDDEPLTLVEVRRKMMLMFCLIVDRSFQDHSLLVNRSRLAINRLNEGEVEHAREMRLKVLKMHSILREIIAYCCFVWIIYVISCSNRNPNAFLQVDHFRHFLLNQDKSSNDFTKVRRANERNLFAIHKRDSDLLDQRLLDVVGRQFRREDSCSALLQRLPSAQSFGLFER